MTRHPLPPLAWKWLISLLALCGALLLAIETGYALRPMLSGQQGTLGVLVKDYKGTGRDGDGTHCLPVETLQDGSPLRAAGIRPGERIRYDRVGDRWRKFGVGEPVGLSLCAPAAARHFTFAAQPEDIGFYDIFTYWGRCLLALAAVLFSLLVGLRHAESRPYRALALTFVGLSLMCYFPFVYAPPGLSFTLSRLANIAVYPLIWYWCVVFALSYQPYEQAGWRLRLTRALPWYRALALAGSAYGTWFGLGHEAPLLGLVNMVLVATGLSISVGSLVDGWRHCGGEIRQRHLWLLLSFACGAIPPMLMLVPALGKLEYGELPVTIGLFFVGQLLMYCGLAYAVLRYRIFNVDFAISRALVFSVVSLLMLCAFGLIEWLYGRYMGGHGGRQQGLAKDAVLALLAFLAFNKVHARLEHWVERMIFRAWHENEAWLRDYVRQAAHITTADALLASLRAAVDRFTGQAGCAIYLRQADGGYALAGSTLEQAPAQLAGGDGVVRALASQMAPVWFERVRSAVRADLALPMSQRGTLHGFVVVGAKRRGASYRPDECEVLAFAAHQVGLDSHALRGDELERAVQAMARKTGQQGDELLLMAGRRRSVRPAAAAPHTSGVA